MVLRLAVLVLRDTARPIGGRLAPVNVGILFGLVQFWTQIPWDLVRAWLAADIARAAAVGIGLLALWQAAWGSTLAALVTRPTLAPFWRTAPGPWTRGVAIAPVLVATAAPVLAMSGLWPHPTFVLAHIGSAIVFGSLATTRLGMLAIVPAAAALFALTIYTPWLPIVFALWVAGVVHRWSTRPTPLQRPARSYTIPSPIGPFTALLYRDVLTLMRTAPDVLRGAVLAAVPAAALVFGFRRNGASAELLGLAAAILACACAPVGGMALERLRANLGNSTFVRRWPPGATARVTALLFVTLGVFAPTGVAMAAALATPALPPMVAPVLPMALAAVTCAAGSVATARRTRFEWGWNLWWIFGVLLLVLWDSAWGRAAQIVATLFAFSIARRDLERG